jgi:hypothetical protein
MKKVKSKTLEEIIDLTDVPNILEEMADNNFKEYKVKMLKNNADPEAIVLDGFDDALIGTTSEGRLVYDIGLMKKVLIQRDKFEEIEADEYLDFNVINAFFGTLNPIYVNLNIDLVLQSLK